MSSKMLPAQTLFLLHLVEHLTGRFIAPHGVETVELGPVNATIHKYNECVNLEELETLTLIYERILETFVDMKRVLIVLAVAVVLAAVIVALPARVFAMLLNDYDVHLLDASGTVWNGSAQLVVPGTNLGTLKWGHRPAATASSQT